jgi:sugar lactone lactonase YvrE
MKKLSVLVLMTAFVTLACQSSKDGAAETSGTDTTAVAEAPPVTLKLKWETDTLLTTCESVLYDKERDVLYVSNINGQPPAKDGNGSIAKVSLDGKIIAAQWVKGMDAPKGLGLVGNKLYVADIDRVHEIDVTSGKITKTYKVDGAKFLNDITTDASGKVYISDSDTGTVSVIENGKLSKWLEGLQGPNGLLSEDGNFLVAQWGAQTLGTVDLTTKQITVKTDSIENPDGIEAIGGGAYLMSSWNGMVHYISPDWKKTLVLDTRADSVSAADIEYIQEKNLLLVPAFFKNKVMAYELTK